MDRGSGILMHISSLPSRYGIGTMGKAAYNFVDFLEKAGQKYWQILPITPTGYGNSPYQSYSTFAGNPYFIDLEILSEDGKLDLDALSAINWGDNSARVDYEKLYNNRIEVLKLAYIADLDTIRDKIADFRCRQSYWIENYAMFMALKYENNMRPYWEWPNELKFRETEAMVNAYKRLESEIDFWVYVQYRFFEQWERLKKYANSKNIKIIGDIPIYVAEDSADAWAHNEILWLDEKRKPVCVAGCPPDYFSPKGQLWGNPLYDWDYLKSTKYEWWVMRIKSMLNLCDVVRIDHFRAFSSFYAIPFGDEDATFGRWIDCPGRDFFDTLKKTIGENLPIIAEDLGMIDDKVRDLLKYTQLPGMKVLQFAFNLDDTSEYLPHRHPKNCVAYIGTHDNDTVLGWFNSQDERYKQYICDYLRINGERDLNWEFIRALLSGIADVTVVTMQDLLGLDFKARMNTPAVGVGNWQWRMESFDCLSDSLAMRLKEITKLYERI